MNARTSTDARKRSLLLAVEQALFDAISDSPELHHSLWQLQRAGYTLRLSIDGVEEPRAAGTQGHSDAQPKESSFRIDSEDLRFLRSVGIDPTRPSRSRKSR